MKLGSHHCKLGRDSQRSIISEGQFLGTTGLILLLTGGLIGGPTVYAVPPSAGNQTPPSQSSQAPTIGNTGTLSYQDLADKKISISVENGSILDFYKAIGPALSPISITIQGRGGNDFRATLKVKDMSLRSVLKAVAAFANCNLYIFPDHFLIAPENRLSPSEKKILDNQHSVLK
jgi:hypothetical protein